MAMINPYMELRYNLVYDFLRNRTLNNLLLHRVDKGSLVEKLPIYGV